LINLMKFARVGKFLSFLIELSVISKLLELNPLSTVLVY